MKVISNSPAFPLRVAQASVMAFVNPAFPILTINLPAKVYLLSLKAAPLYIANLNPLLENWASIMALDGAFTFHESRYLEPALHL